MPRRCPKLVNWLTALLESEEFADIGLTWEDRSEGLFWMPHPRQGCKKWISRHSAVIVEYSRMQGLYKADEKRHLPKWKHNLSTALAKMTNNMKVRDNSGPLPRKLYQIKHMKTGRRASESSSSTSSNPASPSENILPDDLLDFIEKNDIGDFGNNPDLPGGPLYNWDLSILTDDV